MHWFPWGAEAFGEARRRDAPVFVSIGYAACHRCHVMAEESFRDEQIAAQLTEHFVAVKVDREEHPDVERSAAEIAQALGASGCSRPPWPLWCRHPQPSRDEKVVTAWNAMVMRSLTDAAGCPGEAPLRESAATGPPQPPSRANMIAM